MMDECRKDKPMPSKPTYKGYTLVNELGNEKIIFFRPTEDKEQVKSCVDFWESKGWRLKEICRKESLKDFLIYWFKCIAEWATDREQNFCCGKVKIWGCYCRELLDFMCDDEDLDWSDLGMDGELFIHLSIIADNHNFCVLMEEKN